MDRRLKHEATVFWAATIDRIPKNDRYGLLDGSEKVGDILQIGFNKVPCGKKWSHEAILDVWWRDRVAYWHIPSWVDIGATVIEVVKF